MQASCALNKSPAFCACVSNKQPARRTFQGIRQCKDLNVRNRSCSVFDPRQILPRRIPPTVGRGGEASTKLVLLQSQLMPASFDTRSNLVQLPIICSESCTATRHRHVTRCVRLPTLSRKCALYISLLRDILDTSSVVGLRDKQCNEMGRAIFCNRMHARRQ